MVVLSSSVSAPSIGAALLLLLVTTTCSTPVVGTSMMSPSNALTECTEGYVYCPGRSTCFMDSSFNNGVIPTDSTNPWGWNIKYNKAEGLIDNCEIYVGVQGCDISTGVKVGYAIINEDVFHFCLDDNNYEARKFQVYGGKCPASDAGLYINNGGVCVEQAIASYARASSKYTLTTSLPTPVTTFAFNLQNTINTPIWGNELEIFPLGSEGVSDYLVGHLDVCPFGSTPAPSTSFNEEGTPEAPAIAPVTVPTPTTEVSVPVPISPSSCSRAYVYCPGRSTCFMDSGFNNGVPPEGDNPWGWNIAYDSAEGLVDDCKIYTGVTGCDASTGTEVGYAFFNNELFHYCLYENYGSSSYQLYTGSCEASDAGTFYANGGICVESEIAKYARKPENYTFAYSGNELYSVFVFNSFQGVITSSDGTQTSLFPLGSDGSKYLVASLDVCPLAVPTVLPALSTSAPIVSTPVPTIAPVEAAVPSIAPVEATVLDTPAPTNEFDMAGTPEDPGECGEAFLYCPDSATCFLDPAFNNGIPPVGDNPFGWTMDFKACNGMLRNCELWMGVNGCDLSTGIQVGTAEFDYDVFYFELFPEFEANKFALYNGLCEANSGGVYYDITDTCVEQDIAANARNMSQYTLLAELDDFTNSFSFNSLNMAQSVNWDVDYSVMPLGLNGNLHVVAQAYVCPVGQTAAPVSATGIITPAPVPTIITPAPVPTPGFNEDGTKFTFTDSPTSTFTFTDSPKLTFTSSPTTKTPTTAVPSGKPTEVPTTNSPVTAAPISAAPITAAPITAAPITAAPITESPITAAPITEAPISAAPITAGPTNAPTKVPTTASPTLPPTKVPTTAGPSGKPTEVPTTKAPTTGAPTDTPTKLPTTASPTLPPTKVPTTAAPSGKPTEVPTTKAPTTGAPTDTPTKLPTTASPTVAPTKVPTTAGPSGEPTKVPTTSSPTLKPSPEPTKVPSTGAPSGGPTKVPTTSSPTLAPISEPTKVPTTAGPSSKPTKVPTTSSPTLEPTPEPTKVPTTAGPSGKPTKVPTTASPTLAPISEPTKVPTTVAPSSKPTKKPTSSSPTLEPTPAPTKVPTTEGPSGKPTKVPTTSSPTLTPISEPTKVPTTAAPSAKPTKVPTTSLPTLTPISEPTKVPTTAAPSGKTTDFLTTPSPTMVATPEFNEQGDGCQPAYVYCPGRSTCLSDVMDGFSEQGFGGWSVAYNESEGAIVDCEIYVGVGDQCEMSNATKVGTFTISKYLVHYCLDLGDYASSYFAFYAGKCETNDAGQNLLNGGECDTSFMGTFAAKTDTYSLVYESDTYKDTFAFDQTFPASELWNAQSPYVVFPIGVDDRKYMTAFTTVCPVTALPPIDIQTSSTYLTTTSIPQVVMTPTPTVTSVTVPAPVAIETQSPIETILPTNAFVENGDPCEEAYVYCPDKSTSFTDPAFNYGVPATSEGNSCGWSIEYDVGTDKLIDDCQILTGLDDTCNPDSGTVIGSFFIGYDFLHYCIYDEGYVSNSFQAYVGSCEANDNAEHINGCGFCKKSNLEQYATSFATYPLVSKTDVYTRSFTFDHTSTRPSDNPWGDYQIFPMGNETYHVSAHLCITPADSVNFLV